MNCTLATVKHRTKGFDFGQLFDVYLNLNRTCPMGSDIFFDGTRMLTDAMCQKITRNSNSIWTGWTAYPISDIWTRIVVWKWSLFQLISQFPRPPLGLHVEASAIMHLLGDPIDSISSMLLSLAMCQSRAGMAKRICVDVGISQSHPRYHQTWKALAIIMVSYDECGLSHKVEEFESDYLELRKDEHFETDVRHIYEETAAALASDRSTKSLPVVFAEAFFIGGWVISLLKAASSEPNPNNWVNVEAQSIAISASFLWVTSAVIIGSVIGVSQTEHAIPRILQSFEYHIEGTRGSYGRRPSAIAREETAWCKTSTDRAIYGGMYSWKPTKWRQVPTKCERSRKTLAIFSLFAIFVVGSSFATAAILSSLVEPRGLSCRHIPEFLTFLIWLFSYTVELVLERLMNPKIFWLVFGKDVICGLGNIAIMLMIQWGIMNRCSCWTMWGRRGLHLPQLPDVKPDLMHFIKHIAPWIVFTAIFLQLIFCFGVACKYWDAVRVYIQRDDGESNLSWQTRPKRMCNTDEQEQETNPTIVMDEERKTPQVSEHII